MASGIFFSAQRSQEIEDNAINSGFVNASGKLILVKHNGTQIDAGNVKGGDGPAGTPGLNSLYDIWSIVAATVSPPTGKIAVDTGTFVDATKIYIHRNASSGQSFEGLFRILGKDSLITIQDTTNSANYVQFLLRGPVVISGMIGTADIYLKSQGGSALTPGKNVSILYTLAPASPTRGTTAQRDAYFGVPSTDSEHVALANLQPVWYNTQKGWQETYYTTFDKVGLTARGLTGSVASGWFPIFSEPAIFISTTGVASPSGNGWKALTLPNISLAMRNDGFTAPTTTLLLAPLSAIWEVTATVWTGKSSTGTTKGVRASVQDASGNKLMNEEMYLRPSGWTNDTSRIHYTTTLMTDDIHRLIGFDSYSDATFADTLMSFKIKYAGPALTAL